MSDKELESGQEAGEQGLPKLNISAASAAEQPSVNVDDLAAQLEERFSTRIAEEVDRRFKSAKDKRWNEVERAYGDLSEVQQALAEVKAGKDPDEVYKALEQRGLYEKIAQLEQRLVAPTQQAPGAGEADEAWNIVRNMLKEEGLENNPEAIREATGEFGSLKECLNHMSSWIVERKKAPPSPAAVGQPSGGAPRPDVTVDEAVAEFNAIRAVPYSERTPEQLQRSDELGKIIEEAL